MVVDMDAANRVGAKADLEMRARTEAKRAAGGGGGGGGGDGGGHDGNGSSGTSSSDKGSEESDYSSSEEARRRRHKNDKIKPLKDRQLGHPDKYGSTSSTATFRVWRERFGALIAAQDDGIAWDRVLDHIEGLPEKIICVD